MAYAALTSLSQTIEQMREPEQQIVSLQEKVSRILVILEESSRNRSLRIDHLEAQIRDASYQVEYIIESHLSSQALSKSINSSGVMSCFWGVISALQNMIPAIHPRERSVEYVDQNVDMDFQGLQKRIDEFDSISETLSSASSRIFANSKSTMVGFDQDLIEIKDWLTSNPSNLTIISIIGMGGIGKTTLARNLYDDSLIKYHFDICAWVVVSQQYHLRKVLTGLLDSMNHGGQLHEMSIEDLELRLYQSLKGRRYLIVMDDVWGSEAWDEVRRCFPDDGIGSRIILITRLSDVAIYSNRHIHHLRFLSPEQSWNLLQQKVFGEEDCPSALEEIGKEIAQDCKGLPLAIVLIAGILSMGSRTLDYWEYIGENVKSAATGDDVQFMDILYLSYKSLPHHLKPCFLYMGAYREDEEISVSQLIKIWIAEEFVKPLAPKSLEEVAEDYLKDLIDRNLIMVCKSAYNGGIKACIIHDLLRELCVKIAHYEKFLQLISSDGQVSPEGKINQLRVSIHSHTSGHLASIHDSSIRTLLYFCGGFSNSQLLSITMSCRLLRVLDALTIRFSKFPIEVVELVYLRYLSLTYEGTKDFPASISKLQDLQTLIVCRGDTFTMVGRLTTLYLPSTIWEMPHLRHLLFERSLLPTKIMGKDSVALENLQTLSGIINFRCSREVLEMMPNLKKLGISYFYGADTDWSSYEFNNLVYLHQLETLKCVVADFPSMNPLLINFALPPNLRKLTLSGCRIPWEKMTVVGSLPNLEVLKLKDHAFEGPIWEPIEGEFLKLKFLLIEDSNLGIWRADYTHFPYLEHLSLSSCYNLEGIPSGIGDILTLQMLELHECSRSAVASARLIQEEQWDMGNDSLTVIMDFHRDY